MPYPECYPTNNTARARQLGLSTAYLPHYRPINRTALVLRLWAVKGDLLQGSSTLALAKDPRPLVSHASLPWHSPCQLAEPSFRPTPPATPMTAVRACG